MNVGYDINRENRDKKITNYSYIYIDIYIAGDQIDFLRQLSARI